MRRKVPCVLRPVPPGGCLLCGCGTARNRETGVGAVPVVVALPPATAVGTRLGTALSPQRSPPLPLCSPASSSTVPHPRKPLVCSPSLKPYHLATLHEWSRWACDLSRSALVSHRNACETHQVGACPDSVYISASWPMEGVPPFLI